jgi:hypothetical protein
MHMILRDYKTPDKQYAINMMAFQRLKVGLVSEMSTSHPLAVGGKSSKFLALADLRRSTRTHPLSLIEAISRPKPTPKPRPTWPAST